ncbi:hypothetical protein AMTRI_Chr10g225090 [Amborella trichopoda]
MGWGSGGNILKNKSCPNAESWPKKPVSAEVVPSIEVSIYSSGLGPRNIPKYTVQVINNSLQGVVNVHLDCGNFASGSLILPTTFRRLQPGDCLVNYGKEIGPGQVIQFDYTNTFLAKFPVTRADSA